MRVRGRWLAWTAGLAVAAAAGVWATADRPPRLPADADHALHRGEAACLRCHSRTGRHPRPADHPLRDDCFSCHRAPDGRLHPRPGAPTSLPGGWRDDPVLAGGTAARGGRE